MKKEKIAAFIKWLFTPAQEVYEYSPYWSYSCLFPYCW